jgi:hypothetical protein
MANSNRGKSILAGITGVIKGYSDIMQDRQRIQSDVMINQLKSQGNWLARLQFEKEHQEMQNQDIQQKKEQVIQSNEDRAKLAGQPAQSPIEEIVGGKINLKYPKLAGGGAAGVTTQDDIQLAVKGVAEGKIPPERVASYRDVTRVNAELERQGINMSDLQLEWDATKKAIQTMNGPQQIRLRQAIGFGLKSTGDIIKMSDDLARGPNPILNRIQLNAAKQGLLGPDMQKKATLLDQQIADTVSDLGQVYMGGNSPTDHGLELAGKNMSGDWSAVQLKAAAENVQKLLKFRMNSINSISAQGLGGKVKGTYGKGMVKQEEPQFQEGKIYQDAQGNKAKWENGQWIPQEGE